MRVLSVRLIISLILAITLVSVFSAYYQVRGERRNLRTDLDRRAAVLADSLAGNVQPNLENGSTQKLQQVVDRFTNREHLTGVAVFNEKLEPIAQSSGLAERMQGRPVVVQQAMYTKQKQSAFLRFGGNSPFVRGAFKSGRLRTFRCAGHRSRCNVHSGANRPHVARNIQACPGSSLSDCAHHGRNCALEYCRAYRASFSVVACFAGWASRGCFSCYAGFRFAPTAGARDDQHGAKPHRCTLSGRERGPTSASGRIVLDLRAVIRPRA
jgi:hypothetical protein